MRPFCQDYILRRNENKSQITWFKSAFFCVNDNFKPFITRYTQSTSPAKRLINRLYCLRDGSLSYLCNRNINPFAKYDKVCSHGGRSCGLNSAAYKSESCQMTKFDWDTKLVYDERKYTVSAKEHCVVTPNIRLCKFTSIILSGKSVLQWTRKSKNHYLVTWFVESRLFSQIFY